MRRAEYVAAAWFLAVVVVCADSSRAGDAGLILEPDAGAGRSGESVLIRGSGFPPSSTAHISIGGVPVRPTGVAVDDAGRLVPTIVSLNGNLPAGQHGVTVNPPSGPAFPNAYRVRAHVTLDPPIGDGRRGATSRTNPAIPEGGHMGMVFILKGSGFPAGVFIPADSIKVGEAGCVHDPVHVGDDGILPSTTIVVASQLGEGRHDLALRHEGGDVLFSSVFHVAPWSVSDAILKRGAELSLSAAEDAMREFVSFAADDLPAGELDPVKAGLDQARGRVKARDFRGAEDAARQVTEGLGVLKERVLTLRRDKLTGVADVIASGFDTIQPPGAPPNPEAAKTVSQGRRKLEAARAAIERGDFEEARTHLKAGNQLLRDAREQTGRRDAKDSGDEIRW